MAGRINAYFVCSGKYHDIDFARIEILKLLNEKERIRVRMAENYALLRHGIEWAASLGDRAPDEQPSQMETAQ